MRITISKVVYGVSVFLIAALAVSMALSSYAIYQLRVGGPTYERIVAAKDVIADVLPPPLYIIEAYLEARIALDEPGKVADHKARLSVLRRDFDQRRKFWIDSILIPAALKEELTRESAQHATRFWVELEQSYLPLIESQNLSTARYSLDRLG